MKGKVKFFNEMKGFGFIIGDDGTDYFVHKSGLKPDVVLHENDVVSFDATDTERGKQAQNVELSEGGSEEQSEEAPVEEQAEEQSEETQE